MAVYEYDLPGVPENNTLLLDPYQIAQESYVLVPSRPYPKPMLIGLNPIANNKWVGYRNIMEPLGTTNDRALIVPKIPISPRTFNAPVPYPTNASFAGQAPIKGVFTGVADEVTPCR